MEAVAHGIGQALYEGAVYDDSGQLLNASMMDYCIPRADNMPFFETDHTVTPCPHNPLGVKGYRGSWDHRFHSSRSQCCN